MAIHRDRVAALRAQLIASESDVPSSSSELAAMTVQAMLQDSGVPESEQPSMLDVRLYGNSIVSHEIPVREAAAILGSLQDVVSSYGQFVMSKVTAFGTIQADILRATELRLSPSVGMGSVVFHLDGAAEEITGNELPGSTGTPTLLDSVFSGLFGLLDMAESDNISGSLVTENLRPLGSRVVLHLNRFAEELNQYEIALEMSWWHGHSRSKVNFGRRGALFLRDIIERKNEDISRRMFRGTLSTVSTLISPQLVTENGKRIDLGVDSYTAGELGVHFNKLVDVEVEQKRMWSLASGKESFTYKLIDIKPVDAEML